MLDEARELRTRSGMRSCINRLVKALKVNPCLTTQDLKSRGLSDVWLYAQRLLLPACPPPPGGGKKHLGHIPGVGPKVGTAAAKGCARRLFRDAKKAIVRRQYRRTLAHFKAAFTYWKNPVVLYNLALVYLQMGKPTVAAGFLERYLRTASGARRSVVPSSLQSAFRSLSVIQVNTRRFGGDCRGLMILLDGRPVGAGSVRRHVRPGRHRVEIRRYGRNIWQQIVHVESGETRVVGPLHR